MNHLRDQDILWADYVFISAMAVQGSSVRSIIRRCREFNTKIAGGGPLFTEEYEQFGDVDHLVLNEAEITLPQFIGDLEKKQARKIDPSDQYSEYYRKSFTGLFCS